ncbi:MAG TPA: hypothetical protein VFJ30_18465 [Phycisphaerae bacterium]|nr:hypothetical protein [Phycisphaerae bacterium]
MTRTQTGPRGKTAGEAQTVSAAAARLGALARVNWWLWLIPPAVLAGWVGWANTWGYHPALPAWLETAAIWLVAAATTVLAARTCLTRNPLHLIVTVLAANLLCREIHFAGTTTAVFVVGGLCVAWAVLWREKIARAGRDSRFVSWLLAALWAYLLSQLVAKRIFSARHLGWIPNEQAIHTSLEEVVETAAHLMFLAAALVGSWWRWGRPAEPAGPAPASDRTGDA